MLNRYVYYNAEVFENQNELIKLIVLEIINSYGRFTYEFKGAKDSNLFQKINHNLIKFIRFFHVNQVSGSRNNNHH